MKIKSLGVEDNPTMQLFREYCHKKGFKIAAIVPQILKVWLEFMAEQENNGTMGRKGQNKTR